MNELFGDKLGVRLRMEGLVVSNFDVPEAGRDLHKDPWPAHGHGSSSFSHILPLCFEYFEWQLGDSEELPHHFPRILPKSEQFLA